jgi:uncharacterized membrane protein
VTRTARELNICRSSEDRGSIKAAQTCSIPVLFFSETSRPRPKTLRCHLKRAITIGLAVVAGAAVLEAALVPGILLGGAALLAPRLLSGRRRRVAQRNERTLQIGHAAPSREVAASGPSELFAKSQLGRSIAKTITFRIVVTTLDFTTNYIVIGEIATAAGLSSFNLVAGPLFYFAHEAAWNYLGAGEAGVKLNLPKSNTDHDATTLTISPALAKTITYRTIATIVDFTTNYVVVRNIPEALILSATGFFLGPFVYFGHEKAWDYFSGDTAATPAPAKTIELLPVAG